MFVSIFRKQCILGSVMTVSHKHNETLVLSNLLLDTYIPVGQTCDFHNNNVQRDRGRQRQARREKGRETEGKTGGRGKGRQMQARRGSLMVDRLLQNVLHRIRRVFVHGIIDTEHPFSQTPGQ